MSEADNGSFFGLAKGPGGTPLLTEGRPQSRPMVTAARPRGSPYAQIGPGQSEQQQPSQDEGQQQ